MKQLVQNVRTGEALVWDVPVPQVGRGQVLVAVAASLVSVGTERMVVDFAEKNALQKARARPDLVRQVVEKASREGILSTWESVQNRLEQPMALGYSCAGTVIEVGSDVAAIRPGDRVACAGGGYAMHAEVVAVPQNLVVRLPDGVSFETGAFATVGAIALQGIRLSELHLGEVAAVIGLGLLGQLTVQLLKAAGCMVLGMDIQPARAELALQMGAHGVATSAEGLEQLCREQSGGQGADAVLITADTKSNGPVASAGEIARKKGIVVAVGAVGMQIPRKVYYEKELDFRISSSYGPGRYDPTYEEEGVDYPYAYVRWTENRNMQAFVQQASVGSVQTEPLVTHRFAIADAPQAYELITGKTEQPFLGVLLTYPEAPAAISAAQRRVQNTPGRAPTVVQLAVGAAPSLDRVRLGMLGAGNFATATLLPAVLGLRDLELVGVSSGKGISAKSAADRFKFNYCTTDNRQLLEDPAINTLAILTRHNQHAAQVLDGLNAGKHVFVEKPLCLTLDELNAIAARRAELGPQAPYLMVGFNRRFAPLVVALRKQLRTISEPLLINMRANAGFIPASHWTQGPEGGGRLLGEGCHFIDLAIHLAGAQVLEVNTIALPDQGKYCQDNLLITLRFANGSLATVTYVANGDRALGKELVELFGGGLAARMDDYRTLTVRQGSKSDNRTARLRQDKGHAGEWEALVGFLRGQVAAPMEFSAIHHSTLVTLAAQASLVAEHPVQIRGESIG